MDLLSKTTILHGHHAFCYISLLSLQDCDSELEINLFSLYVLFFPIQTT